MSPAGRAALAAVGWAVTVIAYYPGIVSVDSIAQYQQALSGQFDDHHPPLMAWLWSMFGHLARGAAPMLLLHASLIWGGLWCFADGAAKRGIRHAWLVVLAGFLPPIIGIEGMIWKDVGMAAALLFATAILYRASAGGRRVCAAVATISLIAIFYATAVRANAPAAALPIVVYWVYCVIARVSRRATLAAAGIAVLGLLLVTQWGIDTRLLHARRMHLTQLLEAFDLTAIRCAGGTARIPPAFIRSDPRARPLCEVFDPRLVDFLFFLPHSPLAMSNDRASLRELGHAWRQAVLAHPRLYLAQRLRVFGGVLGFGVPDAARLLWQPFNVSNALGLDFTANFITRAIGAGVAFGNVLGLYNGFAWLIVAASIAAIAWHNRRKRDIAVVLALGASAISYTLPYFFVALAPDYRYIYWTIVASAIAAVLMLLPVISAASSTRA